MSNILNPIYNQIGDFSGLENFWNLFETAFGTQYNHTVAANLRSQWQAGDFSQFPKVEVILSDSLDNANGTYDSSTNKIYLSASFVTTAKPETVNAFLLKEIGNFVDAQVNQSNTSGNKGANFAGVVLGNSLTEEVQSVQPSSDIHNTGCSCSSCALPPVDPKLFNNQQEQLVEAVSATLDLSQTFFLNSLAGANHTIYLDFNGHTTTGTSWNTSKGLTNIFTPAYDFDGNTASFSSAELERIQYIWQRVVEDFSPFNVNVTTQAPTDINDLIKSGTGDTRWGVRVAIGGSSSDWYGSGAGGVAYLNSFNWNSDTPTYVFSDSLYDGEKSTAEAISHEVGHTLGLRHDGLPTQGYYGGHGSGDTGWAPIMGVGYSQNLSQWSKGQYSSANNTEDDLQIITTQNGFGYRVDDTGNTIATAKSLTLSGTSWSGSGIIERNTDIDFYSFSTGAGALNLTVNPFSRGPNLDILAQLYNSAGTLIASSNPTDLLSASITTNVVAGTYYLAIDGVGKGDPLSTGYTDYGSLGQYFINGKIDALTYASFSNSGAISIPISGASNPYPSTINVSGVSGNIANLKVTLTNLNHTWADDIDILLVGPTGAKIILMSDVGGSSDLNNVTFTFDASATAALSDEGQLTSGTYLPTDFESGDTFNSPAPGGTYGTDLSVFNNTNPNGVWSLYVVDDDGGGDSGTITGGWSLSIGTDSSLPFITLALSPASVLENGTTNLVYTFTRTGPTTNALTVNYGITGTADSSDYTGATPGTGKTITFAAGSSTATLTIDPTADTTIESDETVALTLATGTGYTIGTTTAVTGTITNDDLPVITVAATDASAAETNTGVTANPGIFTLTRTGITTSALTVNYTLGGTAIKGTDYSNLTGTVTFAVGSSTATVTVTPINDIIFEGTETVILNLATGTSYTLGATSTATVNITDNDSQPTINLSASQTLVEGNTSPQNASYTVTLSNASSQTITVNYATANGSATAGLDYTSTTGTLTFNPGVTSQVINIPILNDSINEANETFTLTLTSPTNASLGTTTSVTTTLTDTITASVTTTLPANVENLTLTGTAAINGTGNAGDNILTGNSGNNILSGGGGNDTYVFVATSALGTDTITETTTGGTDTLDFTGTTAAVNVDLGVTTSQTVNSNLKLIFSANNVIENVTGGTGNDRITGNTLNNTLIGGDGNDQLQGLGGDDVLWGGNGNDILTGGTGNDTYLFQSNGVFTSSLGVDYITQFDVGLDNIVLSKTTFNAVTNTVGQAFTDFAVVSDDELVNASNARIVFSQSSGSLFYNQDGNVLGTGTVFEFARLGNPDITLAASNFSLIA
ncbi:MAG: beta strand repeat-containing protein [Gloeotrichia echinulata GP01]